MWGTPRCVYRFGGFQREESRTNWGSFPSRWQPGCDKRISGLQPRRLAGRCPPACVCGSWVGHGDSSHGGRRITVPRHRRKRVRHAHLRSAHRSSALRAGRSARSNPARRFHACRHGINVPYMTSAANNAADNLRALQAILQPFPARVTFLDQDAMLID